MKPIERPYEVVIGLPMAKVLLINVCAEGGSPESKFYKELKAQLKSARKYVIPNAKAPKAIYNLRSPNTFINDLLGYASGCNNPYNYLQLESDEIGTTFKAVEFGKTTMNPIAKSQESARESWFIEESKAIYSRMLEHLMDQPKTLHFPILIPNGSINPHAFELVHVIVGCGGDDVSSVNSLFSILNPQKNVSEWIAKSFKVGKVLPEFSYFPRELIGSQPRVGKISLLPTMVYSYPFFKHVAFDPTNRYQIANINVRALTDTPTDKFNQMYVDPYVDATKVEFFANQAEEAVAYDWDSLSVPESDLSDKIQEAIEVSESANAPKGLDIDADKIFTEQNPEPIGFGELDFSIKGGSEVLLGQNPEPIPSPFVSTQEITARDMATASPFGLDTEIGPAKLTPNPEPNEAKMQDDPTNKEQIPEPATKIENGFRNEHERAIHLLERRIESEKIEFFNRFGHTFGMPSKTRDLDYARIGELARVKANIEQSHPNVPVSELINTDVALRTNELLEAVASMKSNVDEAVSRGWDARDVEDSVAKVSNIASLIQMLKDLALDLE